MGCCLTSLEAASLTSLCRRCVDGMVASHIAALYLTLSISKWNGKRPTRVSTASVAVDLRAPVISSAAPLCIDASFLTIA